jgi:RNA polymerase-associated protein RTF1
MLARKNQLANKHSAASITMEKARLTQARTLAMRRHDSAELAELDAKLAELAELAPKAHEDADDMLTKVNERNRKANVEAVRQAELREAERKRRERKLALQGGSGAGTPGGLVDPSARLKTVPRLFNTASPRPGTPTTPVLAPTKTVGGAAARPISPLPLPAEKTKGGGSFEASIIDSIEVNLVDF